MVDVHGKYHLGLYLSVVKGLACRQGARAALGRSRLWFCVLETVDVGLFGGRVWATSLAFVLEGYKGLGVPPRCASGFGPFTPTVLRFRNLGVGLRDGGVWATSLAVVLEGFKGLGVPPRCVSGFGPFTPTVSVLETLV